jgi:hypothetical protein
VLRLMCLALTLLVGHAAPVGVQVGPDCKQSRLERERVAPGRCSKRCSPCLLCANAAFAKQGIITFVERVTRVTKESSPAFVPPAERIATVSDQRPIGRDAPPLYLYRVQAG